MSSVKLNKELEILLEVIRTKTCPNNGVFNKEHPPTNWEALLTASLKHGLLPLIYKKLVLLQKSAIPASILMKFKSIYLRILQDSLHRGNQLKKILKIFNDTDIEVIPFKGPVLSIQAYGDLDFRVSADLDILINHKDFSRVYDTLIKAGYEPFYPLSTRKKKLWLRAKRDIEFFSSKIIIDIHQRLSQAHVSFGLSEEDKRGDNFIYMMDQKVKVLSPENTILYMCINHTKDQWSSLKMVSDLSYFIFNNPQIDWVKLIQKAKKMGLLRMVLSGFLLLKQLVDESFPDVIIHEMEKDNKIYHLAAKYKKQLFSGNTDQKIFNRIASISGALDSNRHRFRFLLYFIFAPTPEDFRFLNLPEFLYPLYHLLRPLRLFKLFLFN
jgi:hypothetical protein